MQTMLEDAIITRVVANVFYLEKGYNIKEIATSSNGIYISGENTKTVVDEIIEKLKEMDKKEFESKQFVAYTDQFQWFIGLALFFLCLELLVLEKKTYWVKKLNLFNEKNI